MKFKKGQIPWNKQRDMFKICTICLKKFRVANWQMYRKFCSKTCGYVGRVTKNTFKKGHEPLVFGETHHFWKGNNVGYGALHDWVKKRLAKPLACNQCGEIKPLDLANKSHEYKRELDDWLWLCKKCHVNYDDMVRKSWVTRRAKYGSSGRRVG